MCRDKYLPCNSQLFIPAHRAVGPGQPQVLVTQPRPGPARPSPHLCWPGQAFPAPARCGRRGTRSSLWAARVRTAAALCQGSEGFCVHSEGRSGGGVSSARCPQRPSSPFRPQPLSLHRALAGDRGAQGVCGAAPRLFSQPTLLQMGAGGQLECWASWGAAVLSSSCQSCCRGKPHAHKDMQPLSLSLPTSAREPCCASQALPRRLRTVSAVRDVQGSVLEVVSAHGSGAGTR